MNQPVRMSDFQGAGIAPPSPKLQVPLTEAGVFSCKFIIGEANADAVCCGAPTDGRSWCSYHRTIVFDNTKHVRVR
jgi:hypothetical protein